MPDAPLFVVSWGFFVGCVLAAGIGVLLTRHLFNAPPHPPRLKLDAAQWRDIYETTSRNRVTGIALSALQWGPACVLAVFGTTVEIAQFAVATRTAQIIDFLIPAVIFVPQSARIQSRLCQAMRSARGKLAVDLSVSVATTSICVIAVAILTPLLFVNWYGPAYSGLTALFGLLFLTQWVTGASRPALRQLAADWDLARVRRIMFVSMTCAIGLSLAGVGNLGALATAVGGLVGALLLHGQALESVFRRVGSATRVSHG
jgi:O-antigen/teichoic acid export membrane protein